MTVADRELLQWAAGCMAAIQAEHFLSAHEQLPDRVPQRAIAEDDAQTAKVLPILPGSRRCSYAGSGTAARRDLVRLRNDGSFCEKLGRAAASASAERGAQSQIIAGGVRVALQRSATRFIVANVPLRSLKQPKPQAAQSRWRSMAGMPQSRRHSILYQPDAQPLSECFSPAADVRSADLLLTSAILRLFLSIYCS